MRIEPARPDRYIRLVAFFICAVTAVSVNGGWVPGSALPSEEVVRIEPGQEVNATGVARKPAYFRLRLEGGTSVTIEVGKRATALDVSSIIPASEDPNAAADGNGEVIGWLAASDAGFVEPLVISANVTRDYLLKVTPNQNGSYTFSVSPPRTTTDKDLKYAEANRLFINIRQTFLATGSVARTAQQVEQRVKLYRELNDKRSLAMALGDLALLDQFDPARELSDLAEAKQIFHDLKSRSDEMVALHKIAQAHELAANYQESIKALEEILGMARASGSKDELVRSIFSLGVAYHRLADEAKAKEYYDRSYEIARSIVPETQESLTAQSYYFTNLSNLARGMNAGEIPIEFFSPRTDDDRRQALVYSKNSLDIQRKIERLYPGAAGLLKFNLLQMANTYRELGDLDKALSIFGELADTTPASNKFAWARIHVLRGSIYARKNDLAKAVEDFDRGATILRQGSDPFLRLGYLLIIGDSYLSMGELTRAGATYREALEFSRSHVRPREIASSLLGIARVERELGNFNNARESIEEAIQVEEGVRSRLSGNELRTTHFSGVQRLYNFYIDLLMQSRKAQPDKAFDAAAFNASERARARNLLDLLTISRIDLKQGLDPKLIEREAAVKAKLLAKANEQNLLLLGKHTPAEAAKSDLELSDISREYEAIQAEFRESNPKLNALSAAGVLTLDQVQKLLDSGTALLEYSLGEKKSYLWVITEKEMFSFDLPARAEIEKQARAVYGLISKPANDRSTRKSSETEFERAAETLSETLVGPAADIIGDRRIVMVPDGALHFVPFAALPAESKLRAGHDDTLGMKHEIVTLPSASALGRLRNDAASRKGASRAVAVFADPIFDAADPRARRGPAIKRVSVENRQPSRELERAALDAGLEVLEGGRLPRLPFSRREADAIFKVQPASSFRATDFDATKEGVFAAGLDRYKFVHFATHGLVDTQRPDLSGVVLSLVDNKGHSIDGFLRLQDIYNLKLNADLVVLSACNTALGKEVRGEGLIGLTRGFMYAGAPRVVASLWKVDDAATAELMSIFYRKMLQDQLRPAAALRAAQMELSKQPRWRSPYYWAPFVLQGEWK